MQYNTNYEKSNFHIHLTGSQTIDEIRTTASQVGLSLDEFEPLDDEQSFDSYAYWAAAKELTSNEEALLLSLANVLQREKADEVSYVELTMNPDGMLRRGMDIGGLVEQIEKAYQYGQTIGVNLRVKFGVNRKDGKQSISRVAQVYDATPEEVRFGIDLNGDERRYPTEPFVQEFLKLREMGIPTTIHAGEYPGTSGSLLAAIAAQPSRIGHAVVANESPKLVDYIAESNTTIEVALTSNLKLGAIASVHMHPLLEFLDKGVSVVFGTDDPGIFQNSMSDEIRLLAELGLSEADMRTLFEKASSHRKLT